MPAPVDALAHTTFLSLFCAAAWYLVRRRRLAYARGRLVSREEALAMGCRQACHVAIAAAAEWHAWRPHAILAAMMVLSAACSGALAFAALGALGLQLTFVLSGLSYGVSDTGASMLTLWRWAPDVRMQRVDIAMLNAGFTIGASVSPALVALSLRLGDHRRTFQLLGLAAAPAPRTPASPLRLRTRPRAPRPWAGVRL